MQENEHNNPKFTGLGKEILRRKFRALNTYIKKEESTQNNVNFHFNKLEKEHYAKLRASRRKGLVKITVVTKRNRE